MLLLTLVDLLSPVMFEQFSFWGFFLFFVFFSKNGRGGEGVLFPALKVFLIASQMSPSLLTLNP